VPVVIRSYRHRYGYAPGDPALLGIDAKLQAQPEITVPTINLHGGADGVGPASDRDGGAKKFTGGYERRMIAKIGHNVPQEAPTETVAAIRDIMKGTRA
jgi:pimeloyl-ACP methyl ester carboxylesterase